MKPTPARGSERQLLSRIRWQLIVWYLFAFLLFETILATTTYIVVRQRAMQFAYNSILSEWKQKVPEFTDEITQTMKIGHANVKIDSEPEIVVTWVKTSTNLLISKDLGLVGVPTAVTPSILSQFQDIFPKDSGINWTIGAIGGVPVLFGERIISLNGHVIGYLVSAYSLSQIYRLLNTLFMVELNVGWISIVVIFIMTYFLSMRSLKPIQEALQRQRNFANDAAHELRTPLTILRSTMELAESAVDLQEVRQSIASSLKEVDYITRILGDLTTLSRVGSGAVQLQLRPVNIGMIVQKTVHSVRLLAEEKEISIQCIDNRLFLLVNGDETLLRQLLLILIENAVKYGHIGGHIWITMRKTKHEVFIAVEDDGIGVSQNDIKFIFDRFYRAQSAEYHAVGSGIGLAVAAWIVEAHGGKITVASIEGKGSTFNVQLPQLHRKLLT